MSFVDSIIREFSKLRGFGPYDEPTMMEAALLAEELLAIRCPEKELSQENFGTSGKLASYIAWKLKV